MHPEPDFGPLVLCGYEELAEWGLVLPLYKSTGTANAWYVATAASPHDMGSKIVAFEQLHPERPNEFDPNDWRDVVLGDQFQVVFFWSGRPTIGPVAEVAATLRPEIRDLRRSAPISVADLSLYARLGRFKADVRYCLSRIEARYGAAAAARWVRRLAALQALRVDLEDRASELALDGPGRALATELIGGVRSSVGKSNEIAMTYPGDLAQLLQVDPNDVSAFRFAGMACAATGCQLALAPAEISGTIVEAAGVTIEKPVAKRTQRRDRKMLHVTIVNHAQHQWQGDENGVHFSIRSRFAKLDVKRGQVTVTLSQRGKTVRCALKFQDEALYFQVKATGRDIKTAADAAVDIAVREFKRRLGWASGEEAGD